MTKKIISLMLAFILLINISLVVSEEFMWNTVSISNSTNIVKEIASYWFVDTSASGIGKNKDINILLWSEVEALPFNFSGVYPVIVDWCNYTITHDRNIYDSSGNLLNDTVETTNYFFQNNSLNVTKLLFKLRSRDSLNIIMECHYTDSTYLYVENILVGRFFTYFPSFECDGCTQYSLEEITHQTNVQENLTLNELGTYTRIQQALEWNWELWLIIEWLQKFVFLGIAIFLLFSGVYYFYKTLDNMARLR